MPLNEKTRIDIVNKIEELVEGLMAWKESNLKEDGLQVTRIKVELKELLKQL